MLSTRIAIFFPESSIDFMVGEKQVKSQKAKVKIQRCGGL